MLSTLKILGLFWWNKNIVVHLPVNRSDMKGYKNNHYLNIIN